MRVPASRLGVVYHPRGVARMRRVLGNPRSDACCSMRPWTPPRSSAPGPSTVWPRTRTGCASLAFAAGDLVALDARALQAHRGALRQDPTRSPPLPGGQPGKGATTPSEPRPTRRSLTARAETHTVPRSVRAPRPRMLVPSAHEPPGRHQRRAQAGPTRPRRGHQARHHHAQGQAHQRLKAGKDVAEDDAAQGLAAYAKELRKSIASYEEVGDRGLEAKAEATFELEFCERFLPTKLGAEETLALVQKVAEAEGVGRRRIWGGSWAPSCGPIVMRSTGTSSGRPPSRSSPSHSPFSPQGSASTALALASDVRPRGGARAILVRSSAGRPWRRVCQ